MNSSRCVVFVVLAGCGVSAQEVELDVRAAGGARITSVTTDDGFSQVRQNTTASLVIRGRRLGDTTSIAVGDLPVTLDSVSPREVRVTVLTFGAAPGPVDLTLTTRHGSTTAPAAVELTPFVVSPTAVSGHGTFQSPMNICDPQLELTSNGSRVILLPGIHRCGRLITIGDGATVEGDPGGSTILTGTADGGFAITTGSFAPSEITTIRDITLVAPVGAPSISTCSGTLVVERVVDAGGIAAQCDSVARIDDYTFEGDAVGLDLSDGAVTDATIRNCGAHAGILLGQAEFGSVTLDRVIVEGCETGIIIGSFASISVSAEIRNTQLIDNQLGMRVGARSIRATMNDSVIRDDESTPRAMQTGIALGRGNLSLTDVEISGHSEIGISIVQTSSIGRAAQLFGERLVIDGGQIGISFEGIDNQLALSNSIVRDQTRASLYISSIDSSVDLGFSSIPGNNALSVISGFVIEDDRQFESGPSKYIQAQGTTLNGVSFEGQTIDGPIELAPFYRLLDGSTGIQF
jgi:hypothetical protein